MPTLEIETSEKEKPIILFLGDNPLTQALINHFSKDFKIAYVSDSDLKTDNSNSHDFYRIAKSSTSLIKDLEEEINYAVIFLTHNDRKYLPQIFEKIVKDQTKTIILSDIREVDKFSDIILEYKKVPSVYFLFSGDPYSEKRLYEESEISKIIQKAIKNKTIILTGNDLTPIFPIYEQDAIEGISQILFGPKRKDKFFYLFYSHPQTIISAIHIMKREEPDLEIKYEESSRDYKVGITRDQIEKALQSKIRTTPAFLDKFFIGFEKSIRFYEASSISYPKIQKEIIKIPKKIFPQKTQFKFLSTSLILSFILFIALNIFFVSMAAIYLTNAINAFEKKDYNSVSQNVHNSKLFLDITDPILTLLIKGPDFLGLKKVKENFQTTRKAMNLLSIVSLNLGTIQKIAKGIDRELLDRAISDATYLYFEAERLRNEVQNRTLNTILTPDLATTLSMAQIAPQLFGFAQEKNYLILFQNNAELRPTGGFIGSIGELKIKGGRIEELKIQDVYELDGQLKAHVEPHYIIRRYLQPHLYLRDSNFNPDFQLSASLSALLYNLETKKTVDGVIALDFEAVRRFIKEVGPIKLPSYNRILDEGDTFGFLQETIDDNKFAGSSAKRDVLEALFNQLILKLEEDRNSAVQIARIIPKLMNEKHILLAFKENFEQAIFSANGYGGEINDLRTQETNSINDFLSVNEANIGVNKANIHVQRESLYEASIDKEGITSKVTYVLDNQGDKDNYKAYIRIIVPLGSLLKSINIDGKTQKLVPAVTDYKIYERKNFKPPAGLEVDNMVENDLQVFGFITSVPKGTRQKIEVVYSNGIKNVSSSIVKYSLLLIKQPGTLDYPFTLRFKYNDSYAPKEVENASLDKGVISISETLSGDKEFQIKLIKR